MAVKGRNKTRKTQKGRKSSSLKERIKRAGEGVDREFEAMLKSVGNEELPIKSEKDLLTAIPKGLYRTGKGKLKMLKAGAKGLLGYKKGGSLKEVPEGNKGLKKLPTAVRNKMGYMQKGGSCRGMGKATRGGSYGRMG